MVLCFGAADVTPLACRGAKQDKTLNEMGAIQDQALRILSQGPDPVVRYRLTRDVLLTPPEDHELSLARNDLLTSRWVQALEREQWGDGSWGRLHSQDYRAKQKVPTTEAGVQRALALGLDATHPVLQKAASYLSGVLEGKIQPPDRPEKNDRWHTGLQLFTAATLALIQPDLPILDDVWELWATIAGQAFAAGVYDRDAEARAHRDLTGASVRDSYLVLDNKYTLALLGARAAELPGDLEAVLLNWAWHKKDGLRYLGQRVSHAPVPLKSGSFERWLTSLELLTRFPGWHNLAGDMIQWLWEARKPDGLWDFGPRSAHSMILPFSETWRHKTARSFDWTTRVLVSLRRYHAGRSQSVVASDQTVHE